MRVLMYPDYRDNNPYQALLASHLAKVGVSVEFPAGYNRGAHFSRQLRAHTGEPVDYLHLHWPDIYLRGNSRAARWLYARKLRLDLAWVMKHHCALAWTVHNLDRHDTGGDAIEISFYRWLARHARVLFAHDASLVAPIAERLRVEAGKIVVVPHGHYADHYGPRMETWAARARLGLPEAAPVALFLGMLRPYKGLEELIEVWPAVRRRCPAACLVIAGAGNDAEYIASIVEQCAGVEGVRVEPRFVDDAEIPVFYGAADLAVFPFRAITTSGSLILALSYDCPVVTPRVPSITQHIGFLGNLLYAPGSSQGLEDALVSGLETSPARWREAFARVREIYAWDATARITREGYERGLAAAAR